MIYLEGWKSEKKMFKLANCIMHVSVLSAWAFEIMLALAFYDR
jgi:hypothetical protein